MRVELAKLSLQNFCHVDHGKFSLLVDGFLEAGARDCNDRPGNLGPREITIKISLKPVPNDENDVEEVKVGFVASLSVPKHKINDRPMQLRQNGMVVFNKECQGENEFNQRTLYPPESQTPESEDVE